MKTTTMYQFNESELYAGFVFAVATLVQVEEGHAITPIEAIGCYLPMTATDGEIFTRIRELAEERFRGR